MRQRQILVLFLCALLVVGGCGKEEGPIDVPDGNSGGDDESVFKHLAFNVQCFQADTGVSQGVMANVKIYNQVTQNRVYSGNSNPAGYFCTLHTLEADKSYRVEIFGINSSECYMAFWDVNIDDASLFWVDEFGVNSDAQTHLGSCSNLPDESDCWGN